MTANVEIIVGTYEEFLLGYKLELRNDIQTLKQSFADKSHSGSLKCLAVQGHWIATGGTDDRIFIYDMCKRKQSQIILSHEGTVNALAFTPDQTHILSGGDDGRMIATRVNTWLPEATWKKAHGGNAVTHICCHPSGKLALSLGNDLILRTWNLVKGRVAYKTNLKSRNTLGTAPDCLAWSQNGDFFSISGQRVVEIWSIKTADMLRSQKTNSKPICLCWITNELCLVGLEDGKLIWVSIDETDTPKTEIVAHTSRVKAISYYNDTLVTASSAGEIKLWQVNVGKKKLLQISATNIGCRPICIGILDLDQFDDIYTAAKSTVLNTHQVVTSKPIKKTITPSRGVVTIEYENTGDSQEEENEKSETDKETSDIDETKEETSSDSSEIDSDASEDDDDNDEIFERRIKSRKRKLLANEVKSKSTKSKSGSLAQNKQNKIKQTKTPKKITANIKKKAKLNSA